MSCNECRLPILIGVKPRAPRQAPHAPGTAMHLAGMGGQALGHSVVVDVAYTRCTPGEMKQPMPGTIKTYGDKVLPTQYTPASGRVTHHPSTD